MPTISGRVVYDANRSATIDGGDSGMQNVPVVLQDSTGKRVTASTDATGNYSFINVPDGSYIIVEAYGEPGGTNPADWATAVAGPVPVGNDPPISFATSPPVGANNLDSLSPNTLKVTVAGADIPNQNFLDGPVIYTPITTILDPCTTVSPTNLITVADNGTMGTFPAGTAVDTGEPTNPPYPGVTPDFAYVLPQYDLRIPADGQYTLQNIANGNYHANHGAWWRITDHTQGDETGRFMIVNGANPGAVFFQQTVPVTPNTDYLLSSWIANMLKVNGAPPKLGVEVLDQNGNPIINADLGNSIPFNPEVPEWKQ
ncbi:MAG: SdrD B-like domain-containing protein, partial [Niameybacter sp.]